MADVGHLENTLQPVVEDHGMEIVDLEFVTEQGGRVLRLFVGPVGAGDVSVEDCARISRDCSALLDVEDIIPGRYRLEVSSPGVEKRLRKRKHFEQVLGSRVRVVLKEPKGRRKRYTGTLTDVTEEEIGIDLGKGEEGATISLDNIKKANLKVF